MCEFLICSNTTTSQVTDADYSYWPSGVIHNENLQSYNNTFLYDVRDRLLDINNVGSTSPPFSGRYTYNFNSTINQTEFHQPHLIHQDNRYRYTLSYDNRNQLKEADYILYFPPYWLNFDSYDVTGIAYDRDGNCYWYCQFTFFIWGF